MKVNTFFRTVVVFFLFVAETDLSTDDSFDRRVSTNRTAGIEAPISITAIVLSVRIFYLLRVTCLQAAPRKAEFTKPGTRTYS